ncbi:hypothetical protein [Pantoea sp. WEP]|uniref:hypothetical protein n=1 Tax=Pantoea sp. WEP TaxID=3230025 RepID=UPI00356314A2
MIKYYLLGGSANGTIVERPKGVPQIEIDGDDFGDEDEIYAAYILNYQHKGFCAFGILVGYAFDTVELEILVEKHNLPIYCTEDVTLP